MKGAVWTVDELEFYKRRPQRCTSSSSSAAAAAAAAAVTAISVNVNCTSSSSPPTSASNSVMPMSTTTASNLVAAGRDLCQGGGPGIPALHPFGSSDGPYDNGALLEQLYLPENLKLSGYGSALTISAKTKKRFAEFNAENQRRLFKASSTPEDLNDDLDREQQRQLNKNMIPHSPNLSSGEQGISAQVQGGGRVNTSAANDRYVEGTVPTYSLLANLYQRPPPRTFPDPFPTAINLCVHFFV